ncbi:hypothetical protein OBBRIDRAFT_254615 [Obba rivulosa]|uniref:Uncharacterized protein n=1 Tax=Obba rivulosa TaxID=1052685 RepID=A0A8E2J3H3_9APHY|nr:hypothetical protein OBBRIDRAFT_254615 [Obba rivulosa]
MAIPVSTCLTRLWPVRAHEGRTATHSEHSLASDVEVEDIILLPKECLEDRRKAGDFVSGILFCLISWILTLGRPCGGTRIGIAACSSVLTFPLVCPEKAKHHAAENLVYTECVHVVDRSTIGNVGDPDERNYAASVLAMLERYGDVDIEQFISGDGVHDLRNIMT